MSSQTSPSKQTPKKKQPIKQTDGRKYTKTLAAQKQF